MVTGGRDMEEERGEGGGEEAREGEGGKEEASPPVVPRGRGYSLEGGREHVGNRRRRERRSDLRRLLEAAHIDRVL